MTPSCATCGVPLACPSCTVKVPEWSSTPPTEPGWYWARRREGPSKACPVQVHRAYEDRPDTAYAWLGGESLWLNKSGAREWLWWPGPLSPPPLDALGRALEGV